MNQVESACRHGLGWIAQNRAGRSLPAIHPKISLDDTAGNRMPTHARPLDEAATRHLLRVLAQSYFCPGVTAMDLRPSRRAGFQALALRAVRDSAGALLLRPSSSAVIGRHPAAELERHRWGVCFRSDGCALRTGSMADWVQQLGEAHVTCAPCGELREGLRDRRQQTARGCATEAPHPNTRHDYLAAGSEVQVRAAIAAAAARSAFARDVARRERKRWLAVEKMVRESLQMPDECSISKALASKFEILKRSTEFERCFPAGSVQRHIWDDEMKHNGKLAVGRSSKSFR